MMKIIGILTFSIFTMTLTTTASFASPKSICGQDDRILSFTKEIGRVMKPGEVAGCTITMIGKSCAVSAGHCVESTFFQAQFNTAPSVGGRIVVPGAKDLYPVQRDTAVYVDDGIGNDYAVVRLGANAVTGLLPGDAQGYYDVDMDYVAVPGAEISITGYGADYGDLTGNFAQQFHSGIINSSNGSELYHEVDTMGGNSGSTIIDVKTGKIIGIHTHGGCFRSGGANASTLISARPELKDAIQSCLNWEAENL
jgi:V8-like Glu-specific endopeptidase